jgi:hypothetical protein
MSLFKLLTSPEPACELANYLADFLAIYLAILGELFGNLVAGGQNSDYRRV